MHTNKLCLVERNFSWKTISNLLAEMLNAKRPHFFEVFQPEINADRLTIPSGFIKHMEGVTSGSVFLKGPSDNIWHVNLIQHDGDLSFNDGWPAFVKDHSLECGDSLVFRYDGNLHFTVQVFDRTACEKEAAFHAESSQDPKYIEQHVGKKRERENKTAFSCDTFDAVPKKIRGISPEVPLGSVGRSMAACEEDSSSIEPRKYVELSLNCAASALPSQPLSVSEELGIDGTSSSHCCIDSTNCALALQAIASDKIPVAAVKSRASKKNGSQLRARGCVAMRSVPEEKKAAQSFKSCFPTFVRIMKKFNISGSFTLKVPYKFSMAHLPNCKIKVVLRNLEGQCWTVNSVPTTKVQTVHTFCGGWMAFVRANDIKMGNICIFELVGKCEMRVHVRAGKVSANVSAIGTNAPHSNINGGPLKKTKGASLARFEYSNMSTLVKTGQDGPLSNATKKRAKTSKVSGNSSLRSQSKLLKDKPAAGQNRMSIRDEMGSHAGGSLSLVTVPEEDRRIRYFSSSFPNFITVMKKFNVSRSFTLKIPHKFSIAHLPQCKTKITLRNTKGECWSVNSVPDVKGRPVHTFCGGWMGFVRGNDIKVGDTCIFELVGKCEMCVHVFEAGKKALDYQNGEVAGNELVLNDDFVALPD